MPPVAFLHGSEISEVNVGPQPVQVVKSAVIGLIGTAPSWAVAAPAAAPAVNAPALVSSPRDAANFGPLVQGYSIPYALDKIQKQGFGQVIVVNVFDPTKHFTDLVESLTFGAAGAINLGHMGIGNLTVLPTTATPVVATAYTFAGSPQTIQLAHSIIEQGTVVVTPAAPADWAATHAYALDAIIKPSVGNTGGFYFKATAAGTSGSTEPATWNQTIGGTVVDGSVTWTNVGLSPYVQGTDYSVDYRTGLITALTGSLIASDEEVDVAYSYYSGAPYVLGTDYTADLVNGVVNLITGGGIAANSTVIASFSYADPSKVQDTDIIGAVTSGVYTGLQALFTTYNALGFFAKILIAPRYSQNQDVAQALDAMAQKIRAVALVDSVAGTAVATAIANRGATGQAFNTSSKRTILCFPQRQFTDTGLVPTGVTLSAQGTAVTAVANAIAVGPFSQWVAGVMANVDYNYGYWYSPSNEPDDNIGGAIVGDLGPDVPMYCNYFDPNDDTNSLGAAGIVTSFNMFGLGFRVWGNRSSAYPTSTAPDQFICVRRTMDVIEETLQLSAIQLGLQDKPLNQANVMELVASANSFLRTLKQRGALVGTPTATFNPADNPAASLAAGQAVLEIDAMPPVPMEEISWNVYIDTSQLNTLSANIGAAAQAQQVA